MHEFGDSIFTEQPEPQFSGKYSKGVVVVLSSSYIATSVSKSLALVDMGGAAPTSG